MMRRLTLFALLLAAASGCRATYVAPPARALPPVEPTSWDNADHGDAPTIRAAETQCLTKLSPRAVASAFRAVDEVADALLDLCSIGLVNDDPLVWHLWCGSDALFDSGFYLPPEGRSVQCDGARTQSAFECLGRILGGHLLTSEMAEHVQGVEIVALGSVDRQPINMSGAFVREPCTGLQGELGLPAASRWTPMAEEGEDQAGRDQWNRRLSWCRAAYSATQLRQGMATATGRVRAAAIGAGTDWLDEWRRAHGGERCPTSPAISGERQAGQCRDARRVDVYIRVRAQLGSAQVEDCRAPTRFRGDSAQALYCLSECQARAAVGRNPLGYRVPSSPADLLFGRQESAAQQEGWIVQSSAGQPVNLRSLRDLFLRE